MSKKKSIHSLFTNDALATRLYKESIDLRIKGKWRDAGDKVVKCAEMHTVLRMSLEAATLYTEAAECYLKIDKGEALNAYRLSIKLYCDLGRFDIAGKLERRMADINYNNKHFDDAAVHYRKAGNFLAGDLLLDQSDQCMERCAECLIHMGEYQEASNIFKMIATSCVNTNLRRFNARDYILKSLLTILGIEIDVNYSLFSNPSDDPKSGTNQKSSQQEPPAKKKLTFTDSDQKYSFLLLHTNNYDKIDFMWRCSKEKLFMKNLIEARQAGNIHSLIDHIYYWNQVRPLEAPFMKLCKIPLDEINAEIAWEKRKIENRKAKKQAEADLRSVHSFGTSVEAGSERGGRRDSVSMASI